jgi:hypothetical protein
MTTDELLQEIQLHGNLGFAQGRASEIKKISIYDRKKLSEMPEAEDRALSFEKIHRAIKSLEERL